MRLQSNSIHASVGVMIAIVANTWSGRFVPQFAWGFIWCARLALLPDRPRSQKRSVASFYAEEYMRAVVDSLVPAVAIGFLKTLFRYLLLGRP
jgi:hypothetical protein